MSQESLEWLNTHVLVGFTESRGNAWHFSESYQPDEGTHYPGAIPMEDVRRRLFNWSPVSSPVFVQDLNGDGDGMVAIPDRQAILHSGTKDVLGIFKDGYQPHDYNEWLIDRVSVILDDKLSIGSAGLLRKGAQAWVSVEVSENVTTPQGVVFRPNLLAVTSLDGTLATTYKRCVTNVVCDNTMAAGLSEKGQEFKLKHTRRSTTDGKTDGKVEAIRSALNVIYQISEQFAAEIDQLSQQSVSDRQWDHFLEITIPRPETKGRGQTLADRKRDEMQQLWDHDPRVSPWRNTGLGVLQAVNTWSHHLQTVRGRGRAERNWEGAVNGTFHDLDVQTVKTLEAAVAA